MIPIQLALRADQPIPWIGEPVGDHLAVAPGATDEDGEARFRAAWQVIHRPSGLALLFGSVCLRHARKAARKLDRLPVDWTTVTKDNARDWRTGLEASIRAELDHALDTHRRCHADLICEKRGRQW